MGEKPGYQEKENPVEISDGAGKKRRDYVLGYGCITDQQGNPELTYCFLVTGVKVFTETL